ncbi:S-norcoclaurine synthase 2-like [Durio zibethinus]|uniref:S-norcoclaurine synthase 2-like n=1 Tax=Durio zibethinus TaxID=66656 RepID=A0A6P5WPB3_DURZI|nr:S-norcoclaurine synthase 2-like [Durio zibethinus]
MVKQISFVFFVLFACYIGVNSQELKQLTNEIELNVPAKQLKNVIQSIDVLKGDGGVGTVLKLTFVPGNSSYTERFTVIDDQKRVKVAQSLQGGCLAIGCSVQIDRFDIIEKNMTSSIIESKIFYAVKKEFEAKDPKPNIQLFAAAAQIAKKFLENQHDA